MMSVTLKKIDEHNFETCIDLDVALDQKEFVAPNVYSIAQSKVYPEASIFAIYHENEMVGFLMYGRDNESEDQAPWLIRFMIDQRYQNKGYGYQAMEIVLKKMSKQYPNENIYLSTDPKNVHAISFYEKFGFESTNKIQHDELVFVKKMNNSLIMLDLFSSLKNKASSKKFNGHMLIIKDDHVLFEHVQGFHDKKKNIPLSNQTIFHIASGTKFLTALAIGILIDQKKLDLDTSAKDIVDLKIDLKGFDVKIKHLLSHTSGLPDYLDESIENYSAHILNHELLKTSDYLKYFPNRPLEFEPGKQFKYNNGAYVYLALIIEKISKMSYQDFINQIIFKPLGIVKSGVFATNKQSIEVAIGYVDKALEEPHFDFIPVMAGGDGGAIMNAYDLNKLRSAFYQNKILSEELKNIFIKPFIEVNKKRNLYYGFGLWLFQKNGKMMPYLEGGDAGVSFRTYFMPNHLGWIASNTSDGVWDMIDTFHQTYIASIF
jgi:CubicO group peptidase (beta-lactamase class C family)/ribosomal protein S18 acetylase RimI-like enzyme